jgi:peptide subunit release factor 1 (eRF1)
VRPARLHAATATRCELDAWPLLSALAREPATDWAVALVDNRRARLLRGGPAGLHQDAEMVERSDPLADSEGSSELSDDVREHLDRVGEALRAAHRQQPIGSLLLGCHREAVGEIEARLPPELTAVLVDAFAVDTKASPDEVLAKARPLMDEHAGKQIDEALERLGTAVARGTGARGLAPVLEALTERRVETLLLEDDLAVPGVECPACGWLGPAGTAACPADDTPTEATDDVIEPALARALGQDAAIHFLHERDDLRPDGIAAVLRF